MSFNKTDLEAAEPSAHYEDYPEFEKLLREIDAALHSVNDKQLVAIRGLLQKYEASLTLDEAGHGNLKSITGELSSATSKCTASFKTINETLQRLNRYLNECEQNHEDEDAMRYLRQKEAIAVSLVKNSMHQLQRHQKKFGILERKHAAKTQVPSETVTNSADVAANATEPSAQQIQITYEPVNAEELEQQTLLIQEREREIHQISQDTTEINEIFLNLQDIVQEQQFQIDSIENNILSYSTDAHGASRELRRASRYQKRAGGRMLCCLLILIGVFGSVILVGVLF